MGKKTYEELLKIAGPRLEELDETMQMLEPGAFGRGAKGRLAYDAIFAAYQRFADTGDMRYFEQVSDGLRRIIGYRI